MRTITVEEHYVAPGLLEGPGRRIEMSLPERVLDILDGDGRDPLFPSGVVVVDVGRTETRTPHPRLDR